MVYYSDKYDNILYSHNLSPTNDNKIIVTAYFYNKDNNNVTIYSEDILFKITAYSFFNLDVRSLSDINRETYKGYIKFSGTSEEINEFMDSLDLSKWYINQYLILENTDYNKISEMRYDGEKFVPLKLPVSSFIKAKNSLQRCALDLLLNKDITAVAILGGYGSGKTMLSTQMALYHVKEKGNQSKILGIREPSAEGTDIGYLKGTFEDKTNKFFKPIEHSLKGGEFELNSLIQTGVLEANIPYYLKGTTYNDTVIVVDEAEDLSESQIRLIGTRLGENSQIFFSGDYRQSVIDKTPNNPLLKMCEELKGNPKFGCIILDEDVRSETSKLFANLYKKDGF